MKLPKIIKDTKWEVRNGNVDNEVGSEKKSHLSLRSEATFHATERGEATPHSHIQPHTSRYGFTLIELLVVIAMIGILATIGLNTFPGALGKARDAQRLDDAKKIISGVHQYYAEKGRYPPASGCTSWCNSGAGSATETTWIGNLVPTYLPQVPQDPKDTSSPDLLYRYITNSVGDDYCLEIHQERDAATSRNYAGTSGSGDSQVWILQFGPSGPTGGLCS